MATSSTPLNLNPWPARHDHTRWSSSMIIHERHARSCGDRAWLSMPVLKVIEGPVLRMRSMCRYHEGTSRIVSLFLVRHV